MTEPNIEYCQVRWKERGFPVVCGAPLPCEIHKKVTMTEPNMEWEECSNKDGLCIPEDGLHFVECELYRMKKPESSLRKKWDEGIRPCSFDEVENFMSMAISEAEIHGFCNAQNGYAEVVKKLSDDAEKAEQRGYEKGFSDGHLNGWNEAIEKSAAEERERIVEDIKNMAIETVGNSAKTVDQILSIIHDDK